MLCLAFFIGFAQSPPEMREAVGSKGSPSGAEDILQVQKQLGRTEEHLQHGGCHLN